MIFSFSLFWDVKVVYMFSRNVRKERVNER